MGEPERLELTQPTDLLCEKLVGLLIGKRRDVDDATAPCVANKLAIEPRPSVGLDLAIEAAPDIEIGART